MRINKVCQVCGKPFIAGQKRAMFCSEPCREINKQEKYEEHKRNVQKKRLEEKEKIVKKCPICGKEFHPERITGVYCSKECAGIGNCQKACAASRRQREREALKPKKKKLDNITEIQRKAQAAGLSYGQYIAKYGD